MKASNNIIMHYINYFTYYALGVVFDWEVKVKLQALHFKSEASLKRVHLGQEILPLGAEISSSKSLIFNSKSSMPKRSKLSLNASSGSFGKNFLP